MEDPIRFDIYAKALPQAVTLAVTVLMAERAYSSEVAARKAANHSRGEGRPVRIARGVIWERCKETIANAETAFSEFMVMQEGYVPGEAANHCEKHRVHYGGSLGCQVCNGFYAK